MKKMFWKFAAAAFLLPAVVLTSCDKDDEGNGEQPLAANELAGSMYESRELDASVEYLLKGALLVEDGATLTIPAGTVIKAQKGFGSYILVLQGGKINVNGTADKPVTMTSAAATPAAGDWGGLIINGKAPLEKSNSSTPYVGSTEINAAYRYGGDVVADNSGSITYLKLEYTGAKSSADVEHNGLTLNGVGSGTKIENIYVPNGTDDGIEFFGGSVSVKNLLVVNSDDDMFDMTQGWSGILENCYGVWEAGFTSEEADPSGVEADGNFDGNFPEHTGMSNFTIKNMTIENNGKDMNNVLKIRRGATAKIENALVKGSGTVKATGFVVDLSDSKGNANVASSISITNTMTNTVAGIKLEEDFPNVKLVGGNTGCATTEFAWTGYTF